MMFLVHMAIPTARLTVAKSTTGLSGRDDEFSVPLQSLPGYPAAAWDSAKEYTEGKWLGASQSLSVDFIQPFMADSVDRRTEAFYVAYLVDGDAKTPYQTNFPNGTFPLDPSFDSFLIKFGLEREPVEPLVQS